MHACLPACLSPACTQVAGVEGRHIVLLLTDNNITDEVMLADVNGLLNTGEVTGGLVVETYVPLVLQLTQQLAGCGHTAAHVSSAAVWGSYD